MATITKENFKLLLDNLNWEFAGTKFTPFNENDLMVILEKSLIDIEEEENETS